MSQTCHLIGWLGWRLVFNQLSYIVLNLCSIKSDQNKDGQLKPKEFHLHECYMIWSLYQSWKWDRRAKTACEHYHLKYFTKSLPSSKFLYANDSMVYNREKHTLTNKKIHKVKWIDTSMVSKVGSTLVFPGCFENWFYTIGLRILVYSGLACIHRQNVSV